MVERRSPKPDAGGSSPSCPAGAFMINKLTKYFKETKTELAKVAWPTKLELRDSTTVVVVLTILMSVFIGVIDYALSRASTIIFR